MKSMPNYVWLVEIVAVADRTTRNTLYVVCDMWKDGKNNGADYVLLMQRHTLFWYDAWRNNAARAC